VVGIVAETGLRVGEAPAAGELSTRLFIDIIWNYATCSEMSRQIEMHDVAASVGTRPEHATTPTKLLPAKDRRGGGIEVAGKLSDDFRAEIDETEARVASGRSGDYTGGADLAGADDSDEFHGGVVILNPLHESLRISGLGGGVGRKSNAGRIR